MHTCVRAHTCRCTLSTTSAHPTAPGKLAGWGSKNYFQAKHCSAPLLPLPSKPFGNKVETRGFERAWMKRAQVADEKCLLWGGGCPRATQRL